MQIINRDHVSFHVFIFMLYFLRLKQTRTELHKLYVLQSKLTANSNKYRNTLYKDTIISYLSLH